MIIANKSLGQNFLFDDTTLTKIASYGDLSKDDTVLEIGPGLGTLTDKLCRLAGQVLAVEYDKRLADNLLDNIKRYRLDAGDTAKVDNLTVIASDFLDFDLSTLSKNYKVVANIPYNITSKIIKKLMTVDNRPQLAVLLVQKEVAERLAAKPGKLSLLAISAQVFADVQLGIKVPAELFVPAPKVDSQVVILCTRSEPLVATADLEQFFMTVKAGFAEPRKKLRSSLAIGLRTNKAEAERLLSEANIDPNRRAQELSIDDWKRLARI